MIFHSKLDQSPIVIPQGTFNVGAAAFDIAFRGNIKTTDDNKTAFDWKVPCGITIGL